MKRIILNLALAAAVAVIASCHDTGSSNTSDSSKAVQEHPGKNADPGDTSKVTKDSAAALQQH